MRVSLTEWDQMSEDERSSVTEIDLAIDAAREAALGDLHSPLQYEIDFTGEAYASGLTPSGYNRKGY